MKKIIYFSLVAFLFVMGCSKSDDFNVPQDENQLKSARTATPITPWATPGAITVWDNNDVLMTALWAPPGIGPAYPNYSFTQFPINPAIPGSGYDFSPYYIDGETEYNPANYDLMAHFGYFSPEDVDDAVVEFTFTNIKYFLPHMLILALEASGEDTRRVFTVNNDNNQTVITCITDLKKAYFIDVTKDGVTTQKRIGSPMFCFLLKIDCGKWGYGKIRGKSDSNDGKSGYTTFWTDMKVNGVSVKGTIKDKIFDCN